MCERGSLPPTRGDMGDAAGYRTVVPLLSSYKHGLAVRRLLGTATGGLKLRKSPCRLNLLQLTLYLFPLALALPFIILDALGVWREYYLAAIYAIIHTVTVISARMGVYCGLRRSRQTQRETEADDDLDITSCFSYKSLHFVFSPKPFVCVIIHSLFVCLLLSFTGTLVLLPRVLTDHLPLPGAVGVGLIGWVVLCNSHYSLSVSEPHEVAVYRPTDLLGLGPLTRPVYVITCTLAIITVRLAVRDVATVDLCVQLLYTAVCFLPLGWVVGCLPPLDSLLPWAMETLLTRLMGGSQMATDLRLIIVFLLSLVSTALVGITVHYSNSTPAALLLASATGYLLSHDLFSVFPPIVNFFKKKRLLSKILWKRYTCHIVLMSLRGGVLMLITLLVVYFSSTGGKESRNMAGKVLGSSVVALWCVLRFSGASQGIYILGLFRNPLHPWKSTEDIQRYKIWRKRLSYCSILPQLALTYVSPLLMLAFLSVRVDGNAPNQWLRAVGIARIFRKVWQSTWRAQTEVSVVFLLLLVLPEGTGWAGLGVGLQTLLVGLALEIGCEFLQKLWFGLTLFLKFLTKDGKKIQRWVYISICIVSPLLLLLLAVTALFSSVISAPLLPLFTLPVFLVSFPRTLRFWPSLTDYSSSYTRTRDSVYYQHDIPHFSRALLNVFSTGAARGVPGDLYLLRCQDRTLIASVLERGHRFFTLNFRGLEIEETSCHTIEASNIDDMFSGAYTPKSLGFWFNCHPLNTVRPVDSAVICTYSSSRISLTGVIDQPQSLERFSGNLLKCIVWVLHCYVSDQHPADREGFNEGEGEVERGEHRGVNWRRRRNKIVPVTTVSEASSDPSPQREPPAETRGVGRERHSSWTSMESIEENTRDCGTPATNAMYGLIPADVPLSSTRSSRHQGTVNQLTDVEDDTVSPVEGLPFPPEWVDFPPLDQLDILLTSFPTEWLSFISSNQPPLLGGSTLSLLSLKRLCLMCYSITDVPQSSRRTAKTKPHHIYSGFCGEFPYSTNRDWLTQRNTLHQLILKAYRYSVKLLCDEAALGEAGDFAELSDSLQTYQSHYHIGREGEPDWNTAVLNQIPNLFSMGKSLENNDSYTALVLTQQDEVVHIGQLSSAGVRGMWSDLALELLYLTNDDEERHSIQAHASLLRNITIQAADPPLGYPVFSSGITRCPSIT